MSAKTDGYNPFDPTGMLKTMCDSSMDAWSKQMAELVHSDAYAEASAATLDAWLTSSTPFAKALEAAMTQALENLGMPTRADVVSLAERLTNIETRLDDIEVLLDEIRSTSRPAGRKANGHRKSHSDS